MTVTVTCVTDIISYYVTIIVVIVIYDIIPFFFTSFKLRKEKNWNKKIRET